MDEVIESQIETHETWFTYYLKAWESASEVGSPQSAERALAMAAQHASILTALRIKDQSHGG